MNKIPRFSELFIHCKKISLDEIITMYPPIASMRDDDPVHLDEDEDSLFSFPTIYLDPPFKLVPTSLVKKKQCECGAHKCNSNIHSTWCALYEEEGD